MARREHDVILPISPLESLILGRVRIRVALDTLNDMTDRSYEEGVAKDQIEEALAALDCAVRSLEE